MTLTIEDDLEQVFEQANDNDEMDFVKALRDRKN